MYQQGNETLRNPNIIHIGKTIGYVLILKFLRSRCYCEPYYRVVSNYVELIKLHSFFIFAKE